MIALTYIQVRKMLILYLICFYNILQQAFYLTHPEEIKKIFATESVPFYIGIDPTADSLHVGHFISLMVASHMQKAGHKPIILMGGGTAIIGDPSGKTDMRKMLTVEDIDNNVAQIKKQIEKFLSFEGENAAIIVNNGDWLRDLNYINFMKEIGVHFSVNRMLAAECYKNISNAATFLASLIRSSLYLVISSISSGSINVNNFITFSISSSATFLQY